jgi:hypothetical protein
MPFIIPARNAPLALSRSSEAGVYALFAVAMGLTAAGVYLGTQYAALLMKWFCFL